MLSGRPTKPLTPIPSTCIEVSISFDANSLPNTAYTVFFKLPSPVVSILGVPSIISLKNISGRESAIFSTTALIAIASVTSFFKNFFLAGTFEKRFSIITVVPSAAGLSITPKIFPF